MAQRFQTFEEFWPHYVREHANKLTRQIHVAGTTVALGCLAAGLLTRQRWLLLAAPVAGYAPAWLAHLVVEKNAPLTFQYPLWSVRADLLMWAKTLDGTMDAEVARVLGESSPRAVDPDIVTNMATDGTLH